MATLRHVTPFPEHMLIIGRTFSGKSSLVGDIFSNIDQVYERRTKDNIAIVMSPHDKIDQNFLGRFNSTEDWKIIHFSVNAFDENSADGVLAYLKGENLLYKEVFLFLDDLAINACFSRKSSTFILKAFATFRHYNISLIATVQVGDKELKPLMENCGFIIIVKHFGYHKTLEMILRSFIMSVKVPSLIRYLSPFFESSGQIGDHIVFNFTFRAAKNDALFIMNSIIYPDKGYTKRNIEELCQRL
jgi:hypothetical protein